MTQETQSQPFQQIWQAKLANRMPHAVLFIGQKGTHKAKTADLLSRALLCQHVTSQGEPCGHCHSCQLSVGRTHPNVLWIEPEKEGAAIKVDQIREVGEFINQTSFQGEYRVVIIHPADNMNINAANALLKTLEEPSSGALLILISDQNGHLPATILSRCQRVVFPQVDKEQAQSWLASQPSRQNLFQVLLQLSQGKADPLKSASELQNNDPLQLLDFFLSWVVDLMRLQLNGGTDGLINKDYLDDLLHLKQKTELKNNIKLMEYTQNLRTQVTEGINFNKQLLLETLFIHWMEWANVSS